jgi:hypothetical protein
MRHQLIGPVELLRTRLCYDDFTFCLCRLAAGGELWLVSGRASSETETETKSEAINAEELTERLAMSLRHMTDIMGLLTPISQIQNY